MKGRPSSTKSSAIAARNRQTTSRSAEDQIKSMKGSPENTVILHWEECSAAWAQLSWRDWVRFRGLGQAGRSLLAGAEAGEHYFLVALTVALSLVGVVLWGSIAGSLLPFILRALGFDPASASAPFVATLVDVTGLIIYFSIADIILRGTLL